MAYSPATARLDEIHVSSLGFEQQRFDAACQRQADGDLRGARREFVSLAAHMACHGHSHRNLPNASLLREETDFALAVLQERLGNLGLAARYAASANRRRRQRAIVAGIRPARDVQNLAAMAATLTPRAVAAWQHLPMTLEQPIFLLGVPEAGHAEVYNHLQQHRDVCLLAGQDMLGNIVARLTAGGDDLASALGTLCPEMAESLRHHYFTTRAAHAKALNDNAVIIDSGPYNLPYLGVIARLFPNARLIITVRHPFDLCLSQWMAATPLDDVSIHFTSLSATAALYHRWMLIWAAAEKVLPLNVHNFTREEALNEPAAAFAKLYQFLALRADPDLPLRLNSDPLDPPGRWRRQRRVLAPYQHHLASWAEDLGFPI